MATTTKILRYLAAGQATSSALADALDVPETSIQRGLMALIHSGDVETSVIMGRLTVYRLAPKPISK